MQECYLMGREDLLTWIQFVQRCQLLWGNRTPIIDEECLRNPLLENWVKCLHELALDNVDISQLEVPKRLRRLTIDEAKIIQTFPNNYIFVALLVVYLIKLEMLYHVIWLR